MRDELREVWDFDPILIDWQAIFIFAFLVIYASLALYVMVNHGHKMSIGICHFDIPAASNPGIIYGSDLYNFLYK